MLLLGVSVQECMYMFTVCLLLLGMSVQVCVDVLFTVCLLLLGVSVQVCVDVLFAVCRKSEIISCVIIPVVLLNCLYTHPLEQPFCNRLLES